jgi:L-alanine-DL-glutamate epimerase-like enolase superfamily enzyme
LRQLDVYDERWPLAAPFVISRGAKTEAHVVVAHIGEGGCVGRGEGVPYKRYGESVEGVIETLKSAKALVEDGAGRLDLLGRLPPGAARNALDCALFDLEAKRSGRRAFEIAGFCALEPVQTAYTLSFADPETMGRAAAAAAARPLLKLKIGGPDDLDRVAAVREGAPLARLIVDGNEGLGLEDLRRLLPEFARLGVAAIEQPLPALEDEALRGLESPIPLCADESAHTRAELPRLIGLYGMINIKLDKTGGLTEALLLAAEARAMGLKIMCGCMVGTSLSMAPAVILAQGADIVDLDGPLLLKSDRAFGLTYDGSMAYPPSPDLWG